MLHVSPFASFARQTRACALSTLLLGLLFGTPGAALASYTITDLGAVGHLSGYASESKAYALNDSDDVVGYSSTSTGAPHAVAWFGGSSTPTDLGSLDGNSVAYGINSSGTTIVGAYDAFGSDPNATYAFKYTVSTATLTSLFSSTYNSAAYGVNASNHIVGVHNGLAFKLSGSTETTLNAVGSTAYAINNNDVICGTTAQGSPPFGYEPLRAFVYTTSLTLFSQDGGIAYALNDVSSYSLAGSKQDMMDSDLHQALWNSSGTYTDLQWLPYTPQQAIAYGINNSNVVVGTSLRTPDMFLGHSTDYAYSWHATIYNGGIQDLNDSLPHDPVTHTNSTWELIEARDINNNGDIVGYGYYKPTGEIHAFLMIHS